MVGPSLVTWLHLVSGLHSLVLPALFSTWEVEALGHAEGGHLLKSQDLFQACLFEERSIIEVADFNLITVLKTVHWKPVTDNYLKFKPRFLYKIFYLLSWVLFSVCHYTERNIRFIGPGKRKFGFLIWHLTDSKKALVLIHTSGIS